MIRASRLLIAKLSAAGRRRFRYSISATRWAREASRFYGVVVSFSKPALVDVGDARLLQRARAVLSPRRFSLTPRHGHLLFYFDAAFFR